MESHYEKYIKYKTKYFNLLNTQNGGSSYFHLKNNICEIRKK